MLLSGKRAFRYKVVINIEKINLKINFECSLKVVCKKGKKKLAEIENPAEQNLDTFTAHFDQEMRFETVFIQDITTKIYEEDKYNVNIILVNPNGNKSAGFYLLDPVNLMNNGQFNCKTTGILANCPEKNARIHFDLTQVKIEELNENEYRDELQRLDSLNDNTLISNRDSVRGSVRDKHYQTNSTYESIPKNPYDFLDKRDNSVSDDIRPKYLQRKNRGKSPKISDEPRKNLENSNRYKDNSKKFQEYPTNNDRGKSPDEQRQEINKIKDVLFNEDEEQLQSPINRNYNKRGGGDTSRSNISKRSCSVSYSQDRVRPKSNVKMSFNNTNTTTNTNTTINRILAPLVYPVSYNQDGYTSNTVLPKDILTQEVPIEHPYSSKRSEVPIEHPYSSKRSSANPNEYTSLGYTTVNNIKPKSEIINPLHTIYGSSVAKPEQLTPNVPQMRSVNELHLQPPKFSPKSIELHQPKSQPIPEKIMASTNGLDFMKDSCSMASTDRMKDSQSQSTKEKFGIPVTNSVKDEKKLTDSYADKKLAALRSDISYNTKQRTTELPYPPKPQIDDYPIGITSNNNNPSVKYDKEPIKPVMAVKPVYDKSTEEMLQFTVNASNRSLGREESIHEDKVVLNILGSSNVSFGDSRKEIANFGKESGSFGKQRHTEGPVFTCESVASIDCVLPLDVDLKKKDSISKNSDKVYQHDIVNSSKYSPDFNRNPVDNHSSDFFNNSLARDTRTQPDYSNRANSFLKNIELSKQNQQKPNQEDNMRESLHDRIKKEKDHRQSLQKTPEEETYNSRRQKNLNEDAYNSKKYFELEATLKKQHDQELRSLKLKNDNQLKEISLLEKDNEFYKDKLFNNDNNVKKGNNERAEEQERLRTERRTYHERSIQLEKDLQRSEKEQKKLMDDLYDAKKELENEKQINFDFQKNSRAQDHGYKKDNEKAIASYKEKVSFLEDENKSLNDRIVIMDKSLMEMPVKIRLLESESNTKQTKLEIGYKDLQEDYEKLENENNELQEEINDLNLRILDIKDDKEELQAKLEQERLAGNKTSETKHREQTTKDDKISYYKEKNFELEKEIEDLKRDKYKAVLSTNDENKDLLNQIYLLKDDIVYKDKSIEDLKHEKKLMEEEMYIIKNKYTTNENKLKQVCKYCSNKGNEFSNSQERKNYQIKIQDQESNIENQKKRINELEDELDYKTGMILDHSINMNDNELITKLSIENENYAKQIRGLSSEVNDIARMKKNHETEREELKKTIDRLSKEKEKDKKCVDDIKVSFFVDECIEGVWCVRDGKCET